MEVVEPYARILDLETREDGIRLMQKIEWAARVSHRSEEAQGFETWERFLRFVVLGHGDLSVVEHASVSVDVVADRGICLEIVRHRLFSYTMESTRFVNYAKKIGLRFVKPRTFSCFAQQESWENAMAYAEESYHRLLQDGCAPQIARSVLPNSLASRLVISGNLRSWRHFLIMRTTKETHPQMKQVTLPLLAEFQSKIPILFEDIVPHETQATAMAKVR